MAERTGCPILLSLWSYVTDDKKHVIIFSVAASWACIGVDIAEQINYSWIIYKSEVQCEDTAVCTRK